MHEKCQTPEETHGITPSYYIASAEKLLSKVEEPSPELLAVLAVGSLVLGDEQRAHALIDEIQALDVPESLSDVYVAAIDLGIESVQERLNGLPTQLFHAPAQQVDLLLSLIKRGINMDTNAENARAIIDAVQSEKYTSGFDLPFQLISVLLSTGDYAGATVMTKHYFGDSASFALFEDSIENLTHEKGLFAKRKLRKEVFQTSEASLRRLKSAFSVDRHGWYDETDSKVRTKVMQEQSAEFIPAFLAAALLVQSGDEKSAELFKELVVSQSSAVIPIVRSESYEYLNLNICNDVLDTYFRSNRFAVGPGDQIAIKNVLSLLRTQISGNRSVHLDFVAQRAHQEKKYVQHAMRVYDHDVTAMRLLLSVSAGQTLSDDEYSVELRNDEQHQLNVATEAFIATQFAYGIQQTMRLGSEQQSSDDYTAIAHQKAARELVDLELELRSYVSNIEYWESQVKEIGTDAAFQMHAVKTALEDSLAKLTDSTRDMSSYAQQCRTYIKILEGYAVLEGGIATLDLRDVERFNQPDENFLIRINLDSQTRVLKQLLLSAADSEILGYYPDYDRDSVLRVLEAYGLDGSRAIENAKKLRLAVNGAYSRRRR